jgi:hypothetical protein
MIKLLSTILRQSAWLACLLLSLQAYADGVSIDRASGRTKDNVYLMDAAINYELSDSVLEAVNHGIQLYFDVTIEVRQEHKWLWDDVLKTVTLGYLLQYRPLSSDYLVTRHCDTSAPSPTIRLLISLKSRQKAHIVALSCRN